ncbi:MULTISPECIES: hypothetical protein, partial [unclassified Rhizobium]|uniref:hypothetical protein n=1 Tax=unclassified Rhizobium TaxID=2613769 RepID=UPI001ADC5564
RLTSHHHSILRKSVRRLNHDSLVPTTLSFSTVSAECGLPLRANTNRLPFFFEKSSLVALAAVCSEARCFHMIQ